MQLARVLGRVVSDAHGGRVGKAIVAVDRIGVGPDEVVFFITSREAALTLDQPFAAVDAGIVGNVDHVDVDGERLLADQR